MPCTSAESFSIFPLLSRSFSVATIFIADVFKNGVYCKLASWKHGVGGCSFAVTN